MADEPGQLPAQDTIFALATGAPPTAIAIIRVSGPLARHICSLVAGSEPPDRRPVLRVFRAMDGREIDHGLVIFFPAPNSATGDDCAEFHCHGGKAVVAAMMAEISHVPGVRLAEAGEFTRRALANGRIDLVQVEALADLVDAETEGQRRLAAQGLTGAPSRLYDEWAERLTMARAMVEAELDFSDQEDVSGEASRAIRPELEALLLVMRAHLGGTAAAEIIRDGFRVAIMGPPNAGKSSLINALAQREVAIVSEEAGTTRDLVEVSLDIGGQKVIVTDTAGIRKNPGRVEAIGIERAIEAGNRADLVLWLQSVETRMDSTDIPEGVIVVRSKIDLGHEDSIPEHHKAVSTVTGAGIDALIGFIGVRASTATVASQALPIRLRHSVLVKECLTHLETAMERDDERLELQAEHLRLASHALGRITGTVDVEDLLDRIFSSFCIGK